MSSAKSHSAQPLNSHSNPHPHWGAPPWHIDFAVRSKPVPPSVDFAIVGGGFTGLAAAAWLRHLAPEKSVAVFEAHRIGAGASGRTGGMALAESAAGDLPGLGNVLGGLERILAELDVDCDLSLPGAFEIGRSKGLDPLADRMERFWNLARGEKSSREERSIPGNSWPGLREPQTNAVPQSSKAARSRRSNGSAALSFMLWFTQAAHNALPGKSSSPRTHSRSHSHLLPVAPSPNSRSRFSPSQWMKSGSKPSALREAIPSTRSICRTCGAAVAATAA